MKKLLTVITLFLGVTFYSFSQDGIAFHFKSTDGTISSKLNDTYSMSFTISGLTSENEINNLRQIFTSNSNVKQFEIFSPQTTDNKIKARLVLISKDKEKLVELFKSANVNKLVVDGKEYTLDQLDQLKSDLKAKHKEVNSTSSASQTR
jgi:hypothetical protein